MFVRRFVLSEVLDRSAEWPECRMSTTVSKNVTDGELVMG